MYHIDYMKHKHTKLLSILPLLPLLMGAAATNEDISDEYRDFELSYISEDSLYQYNFYKFHLKNTGECYLDCLYIGSNSSESSFSAYIEGDEICPPFYNGLIEPGFDKDVVFTTKNKMPESHDVTGKAPSYLVVATGVSCNVIKDLSFSLEKSDKSSSYYVYDIDVKCSGLTDDYNYSAAIKITYDGEPYCLQGNIYAEGGVSIVSSSELDLKKLTLNEIVPLRSAHENYYERFGIDFSGAFRVFGILLLIFFLLLSFGIFSAIFFPAMARRRRRNRMNAANK